MRELNESSGGRGALSERASMLSRLDEDHSHLFPSPSAVRMSDRTHITFDSFHIHTTQHTAYNHTNKNDRVRHTLWTMKFFLGLASLAERQSEIHEATNATTLFSENEVSENVFPSVSNLDAIHYISRCASARASA